VVSWPLVYQVLLLIEPVGLCLVGWSLLARSLVFPLSRQVVLDHCLARGGGRNSEVEAVILVGVGERLQESSLR
jgi:hypothetical protein